MKENIISLREHPEMLEQFIAVFSSHYGNAELYCDCMTASLSAESPLPQWYLAIRPNHEVAGCAGLITNDFISRMDLYPWLCALFVEEAFRHRGIAGALIEHIAKSTADMGFRKLYCATDHTGFYEHFGFNFIGTGYHPWGETSRIYCRETIL